MPGPSGERGPCQRCAHMRMGFSVARSAFDEIPPSLNPMVRPAQSRKMDEENQASKEVLAERGQLREYAESGYAEISGYSRRPTMPNFMYCGIDEFNGAYACCEVKNRNDSCADFTPKVTNDSPRRDCASCRYNWKAPEQLFLKLEEVLGRDQKGHQLRDQVRQQFEYQADDEYQACVDSAGFLERRPGLLPLCEARSTEGSASDAPVYVVGPVVNRAARCELWASGSNETRANVSAVMQSFDARAQQAATNRQDLAFINPFADVVGAGNPAAQIQGLQEVVANNEADLIEFCLLTLGTDPSFSTSVATRFASDVWYSPRRPTMQIESGAPRLASRPMSAPTHVTAPNTVEARPSEPFETDPMGIYKHPDEPIALINSPDPPRLIVIRTSWDPATGQEFSPDLADAAELLGHWAVSEIPTGVWTQLFDGNDDPLPVTVNIQPPASVYAAWYQV